MSDKILISDTIRGLLDYAADQRAAGPNMTQQVISTVDELSGFWDIEDNPFGQFNRDGKDVHALTVRGLEMHAIELLNVGGLDNVRRVTEMTTLLENIGRTWADTVPQIKEATAHINAELSARAEHLFVHHLYSPLEFQMRYDESDRDGTYDDDHWRDEISHEEAWNYLDEINAQIAKENSRIESPRGLMDYFDADRRDGNVADKVFSLIAARVEEHCDRLWLVADMRVTAPLTADEIAAIKDYYTGQLSDGWGEGFEQREIKIRGEGGLYVEPWQSEGFAIHTAQEFSERYGVALEQLEGLERKTELSPQEQLAEKLDAEMQAYTDKLLTRTKEQIIGDASDIASMWEAHFFLTEDTEWSDEQLQALLETDNVIAHVAEVLRDNNNEAMCRLEVDTILAEARIYVELDYDEPENPIVLSGMNPDNPHEVSVLQTIAKSQANVTLDPISAPLKQKSHNNDER